MIGRAGLSRVLKLTKRIGVGLEVQQQTTKSGATSQAGRDSVMIDDRRPAVIVQPVDIPGVRFQQQVIIRQRLFRNRCDGSNRSINVQTTPVLVAMGGRKWVRIPRISVQRHHTAGQREIAGHRRNIASKLAGRGSVPATRDDSGRGDLPEFGRLPDFGRLCFGG